MNLPIVINTNKKVKISEPNYNGGFEDGIFLTEDGTLGIKCKNGEYFDMHGNKLNVDGKLGYKCHVEGGCKGIVIEENVDEYGDKTTSHPAYGVITVTRQSAHPSTPLFGSSIKHSNLINITISHGEVKRQLNHDWYHANGRICELELSLSQFANLITSIGNGDGVPCTIHFTECDGYTPRIDYESKIDQHRGEFREHLSDIRETADDTYKLVKELFEIKKSLNKADKDNSNSEYAMACFNHQMEKSVNEAKGEVEAFIQSKMHNIALQAIGADDTDNALPQFDDMVEI